ncbi:MAG: hypothetical protein ACD_58C00043G0008 [uncultured bacterium]|nr:MAG: hypothetical protein ACD_58C00043G0008 [uncultured bacterium]
MISYLCGTIKFIAPNWLILDVNGVGYKVYITTNYELRTTKFRSSKLEVNSSAELYVYHHIREDASDLYGLETPEELQMFELLISVSGVGPKMAMNILSTYDVNKITQIIINSDASSLTAVSGVGKKLSMKMILDLKSKLDSGAINSFDDFDNSSQDLFDALESLGYKKHEVSSLLAKIPSDLDTIEKKVRWILKHSKK